MRASILIGSFVVIIAVIIFLIIVWYAFYMVQDKPKRKRKLKVGDDGELVAIEGVIHNQSIRFRGKGAQTTKPFDLEPGTYKLSYQFPESVLVKVDLISSFDGDSETILVKSGVSSKAFNVQIGGRYFFRVEPTEDNAHWEIECQRLSLPSRSDQPLGGL